MSEVCCLATRVEYLQSFEEPERKGTLAVCAHVQENGSVTKYSLGWACGARGAYRCDLSAYCYPNLIRDLEKGFQVTVYEKIKYMRIILQDDILTLEPCLKT